MNRQTLEVFHGLMKKGWIDRREDAALWNAVQDSDVRDELEDVKSVMCVELIPAGDRIYMVPTQDNDLFLKNNYDYRRDIHATNSIRNRDLYLMNYLSIYLIYTFFHGEGSDPLSRDFISKEEFISEFTKHCKMTETIELSESEDAPDYSENFIQLAKDWLNKLEGPADSGKAECRYGVLNKILQKYKADEIFDVGDDGLIRPTRKMKDLMPYFLRKDRVAEIQNWIRGGANNAENQ